MMDKMTEPASGLFGAMLWKFGAVKITAFSAALLGAAIMSIFRPPKSRKELFLQGAVALGSSLLFGGALTQGLAHWTEWVNLQTSPVEDVIQFSCMVHGLIGALSWGIFGGLAVLRDRLYKNPIETLKDIKDVGSV